MAKAIESHEYLRNIHWNDNTECGDAGLLGFMQSLLKNKSIGSLNMNNCGLTGHVQGHPGSWGDSLRISLRLHTLSLSHNIIDDAGCVELCDGLMSCLSVRHVDISYNEFGASTNTANSFCNLLSNNKCLLSINIAGNMLSDEVWSSVAYGLGANNTLMTLDVRWCELSRHCGGMLCNVLKVNRVCDVIMNYNPVPEQMIENPGEFVDDLLQVDVSDWNLMSRPGSVLPATRPSTVTSTVLPMSSTSYEYAECTDENHQLGDVLIRAGTNNVINRTASSALGNTNGLDGEAGEGSEVKVDGDGLISAVAARRVASRAASRAMAAATASTTATATAAPLMSPNSTTKPIRSALPQSRKAIGSANSSDGNGFDNVNLDGGGALCLPREVVSVEASTDWRAKRLFDISQAQDSLDIVNTAVRDTSQDFDKSNSMTTMGQVLAQQSG